MARSARSAQNADAPLGRYYVYILDGGSYAVASSTNPPRDGTPISLSFGTHGAADDNRCERMYLPLNDRQHQALTFLESELRTQKATPIARRNMLFLERLLREGQWRASHLRPTKAFVNQVISYLAGPQHGAAPREREAVA